MMQMLERQQGQVTLYLSETNRSPPVPFELHGHISQDDWAIRVPALTMLTARYNKPIFERIWIFFAIIVSITLPWVLYHPIFVSIYRHGVTDASFVGARLLGVAIFTGSLLLLFTPLIIWKITGRRRVNALLASYAAADGARPSDPRFIPTWKVAMPGLFSTRTTLTITLPPNVPITTFHPDAYLPHYISKNAEVEGAYFYPYRDDKEPGLPKMSVVGGYGAEQEKV